MQKSFYIVPTVSILFTFSSKAQITSLYLDPTQPLNVKVDDLLSKMTLKEKGSQLMNSSPAIPRLHIPAYDCKKKLKTNNRMIDYFNSS